MKNFDIIGNCMCYCLTAMQTEYIFRIVQLVLSIIISLSIIIPKIVSWYEKAIEDKKITKEEIKDLKNLLSDDVKNMENEIVELVETIEKEEK